MKNLKLISLLAAAALAVGVLTACGAASSASQAASSGVTSSAAVSSAASEASSSQVGASAAALEASFTVTDSDGNATSYTLAIADGEKLSDALAAADLISADEAAAGFVTTVNGVTADYNKDKAWWMLVDKDGKMTDVGIGDITLAQGDSYGFVYTIG